MLWLKLRELQPSGGVHRMNSRKATEILVEVTNQQERWLQTIENPAKILRLNLATKPTKRQKHKKKKKKCTPTPETIAKPGEVSLLKVGMTHRILCGYLSKR